MWTSTFRMEIEVLFPETSWQMSIYCLIPWNIIYVNIRGCGDGKHWEEKHVLCKHYGSVTFTSSLLERIGTISWERVLKEIFHLFALSRKNSKIFIIWGSAFWSWARLYLGCIVFIPLHIGWTSVVQGK